MTYEEILLNPNIPFNTIIEKQFMPKYLYKYQCFYSEKLLENKFWKENIKGSFHLSLGSEFEDNDDCRPYFNKNKIIKILYDYLEYSKQLSEEQIKKVLTQIDHALTPEYFDRVTMNYQNHIRIGCFTKSSDNITMWEKYANKETGFCIEYETSKNQLFMHSTLPVLYLETPYDISLSLVSHIIIDSDQKARNLSDEEKIKLYEPIYEKSMKVEYIPIFIKEKKKWSFEQEYRMFLLKNRSTAIGKLKAAEILDEKFNIDLSDAITAIYLGARFAENKNCDEIKDEIIQIVQSMRIKLFQRKYIDGLYVNERII